VAEDVTGDVPQDVAQDLAFGARAARALIATTSPPLSLRSSRVAEIGRNWAAQWHLARAVGKRFRGCRAKRFNVNIPSFSFGTGPKCVPWSLQARSWCCLGHLSWRW